MKRLPLTLLLWLPLGALAIACGDRILLGEQADAAPGSPGSPGDASTAADSPTPDQAAPGNSTVDGGECGACGPADYCAVWIDASGNFERSQCFAQPAHCSPIDGGSGVDCTACGAATTVSIAYSPFNNDVAKVTCQDGAGLFSPQCILGEGLCCTSSGFVCDPGGGTACANPLPDSMCDASCLAYTIPVACSLVLGPLGPTMPLPCADNPGVCTPYGAGCDTTQSPAICACPSCENGALCGGPSCGTGLTCIGKKTGAQTGPVCVPSFTCCSKSLPPVDPTCTAGSCVCPMGYSQEPLGSVCDG